MSFDGYDAVRAAAGLVEPAPRRLMRVTGSDRIGWLQGLLTNDLAALVAGQGCYAAYLTPQGRMISDVRVLVLDGACLLDVPARTAGTLRDRFEMYIITEDVQVSDLSDTVGVVAVHGPASAAHLARWAVEASGGVDALTAALEGLPEGWHVWVEGVGADRDGRVATAGTAGAWNSALVVSSRAYGVRGFDVFLPVTFAAEARDALVGGGAVPVAAEAAEALRIEAGRPEFGLDMDEETIPLETGVEDRMVSFTKGCYVGQEVIVRVRDRGHGRVARRLVGLVSTEADAGRRLLSRGLGLVDGERDVGRITSAAYSPTLGREIALGYVHRDFVTPGCRIEAVVAGGRAPLDVTALPLVGRR